MDETKRDSRTQIEKLAASAFKNHVLTYESKSNTWYCGEPGTGIYHFRVAELPGAILVWGDIGTLVIMGRHYGLEWASGSLHSPEYFLSKTTLKKDCFSPADFRKSLLWRIEEYEGYIEDGMGEYGKQLAEARQDLVDASHYDFDVTAYHEYMSKHPDAELYESVYGYDSSGYWIIEALKVFFKLYDEQKANATHTQDLAGTVSGGVAGT